MRLAKGCTLKSQNIKQVGGGESSIKMGVIIFFFLLLTSVSYLYDIFCSNKAAWSVHWYHKG